MDKYQQIVNPLTNRSVSITGRIGRQILKNYLRVMSSSEVYHGGADGNLEPGNEERLEDGHAFIFYRSIRDANTDRDVGEEFNLGEMPLGAWITYNDNLYQIIRFDNDTDLMICRDSFNSEPNHQLDATDNATYWGYWEDVPEHYHTTN
jgi:hypothetical protein